MAEGRGETRKQAGWLERAARRTRRDLDRTIGTALRSRRNAGREYRPIFVAAAMGSGSSVLAVDLFQRFAVAGLMYESALQVDRRSFLRARPLVELSSVSEYEQSITPQPGWEPAIGREALLACYRAWSSRDGSWIVDKGPNTNLVRASFLARCFPDAKFLLLLRDPVANIEGFLRKWPLFGREGLERSIAFYGSIHSAFLRFAEAEPQRVRAVEYQDVVQREGEIRARIAAWLKLDPARSPRSLERRPNVEGLGVRNLQGDRVVIVGDADAAAYRRLPPDAVEVIRSRLGGLRERVRARIPAI